MNAITKLAGAVLLCLMAGCAGGPKPGADVDGLIVIDVETRHGQSAGGVDPV